MSDNNQDLGYGFVSDTDESLKSKSGGQFGLNQGAFLTKFEYNDTAGPNGSEADALDITIQIEEREYMSRIFPITKVFDKNRNVLEDKDSDEYKKQWKAQWSQASAVITHILKAFVDEDTIKKAFSVPIGGFKEYVQVAESIMPDDHKNKPLDVFLEFQYSIKDGEDATYLQVPKNMKGGYFLVPEQPGKWEKKNEGGNLVYREASSGEEHPFTRDKKFMESPKSYRQSSQDGADALNNAAGGSNDGAGKEETW